MTDTSRQGSPLLRVMSLRDFRLLFGGASLSLLGDQFALIATPWLTLQLTGDARVLGLVLALEGLPRAAFLLLGGAITDRLSPRRIMLLADCARLALVASMALAALSGAVAPWMLYVFAPGFGLVAGFAMPAENSIVPMLVHRDDLQAGNALIMGMTQIAGFVGPSLAGVVIGGTGSSLAGIGHAYAIDAASFAASAFCLFAMRDSGAGATPAGPEGLCASIRRAFAYLWGDPAMRLMVLLLAAINFLVVGPLLIGIPLLARARLPDGAVAFGILMSAFSAGNLIGFLLAGAAPRPGSRAIKAIIIALLGAFGGVLGVLGFLHSTSEACALLLLLGLGNGYIAILLFTWLQGRTPREMLGRVMSVLMIANTGLVPLSQSIAGVVGKWNLDLLLLGAGGLTLMVGVWAATRSALAVFADSLAQAALAEA